MTSPALAAQIQNDEVDLTGADLTGAKIVGTRIEGRAVLCRTVMPDGEVQGSCEP